MLYQYSKPAPLELDVMADPAGSWLGKHNGQLKRISPEETHHAFILATARDLKQGAPPNQCQRLSLNLTRSHEAGAQATGFLQR